MSQQKTKFCNTVGQLIEELEKLPKDEKLDEKVRPVHFNTGPKAKKLGAKPYVVLFREDQ